MRCLEVRKLANEFLKNKIQTIVFARSRVRVEILLTYLQELVSKQLGPKSIRGYRGGYLPTQRREIEQGAAGMVPFMVWSLRMHLS